MTDELSAKIVAALAAVDVAPDLRKARVAHRVVTADDRKGLQARLAGALYDVLHAGRAELVDMPRSVRDPEFEQALLSVLPHRTSRVVTGMDTTLDDPAYWLLRLNGVRVRIGRDEVELEDEVPGVAARWVRLPAARPALSPGFLLVDGSQGSGALSGGCVRVYVHIAAAELAPQVWGAVLGRLETAQVPYRAKVVSSRRMYPRRDAMVVYLGAQAWSVTPSIAHVAAGLAGIGADVSVYTERLCDGVAWAFEPDDPRPGMRGMSFGEHRSHALATGLISAAAQPGGTDDSHTEIVDALRAARIGVSGLHRNEDSPEFTPTASPAEQAVLTVV